MGVERAEAADGVEVDRPRVVLVIDAGLAIVDEQPRVAQRTIHRGHHRHHHQPQPIHLQRLAVARPEEAREAEGTHGLLQRIDRVVGQDNGGVLRDVVAQEFGIEMVVVQVGDVQVGRGRDLVQVDGLVAREGKPGRIVGRIEPRVAQNAPKRVSMYMPACPRKVICIARSPDLC